MELRNSFLAQIRLKTRTFFLKAINLHTSNLPIGAQPDIEIPSALPRNPQSTRHVIDSQRIPASRTKRQY
jgi:hypothetical protein